MLSTNTVSPPAVLNPWTTIWIHPRSTFRHVLRYSLIHPVRWLATTAGAASGLRFGLSQVIENGDGPLFVVTLVLVGALFGGVMLLLPIWIFGGMARWLGGTGNAFRVRIVFGWSLVPIIGLALVRSVLLAICFLVPDDEFGIANPRIHSLPYTIYWVLGLATTAVALLFSVLGLAEAHRLSLGRSLIAILVPQMLFVGLLLACLYLLGR